MIKYVIGDATEPQGEGNKLIIHCCNDSGGWGRGFVLALSAKWDKPEQQYRSWSREPYDGTPFYSLTFELGQIDVVKVEHDIYVVNMIGQRHYHDFEIKVGDKTLTLPPIRYGAIEECLLRVAAKAKELNATVHAPRFGAGLAKGNWDTIEEIINRILIDNGIEVTVYDLE